MVVWCSVVKCSAFYFSGYFTICVSHTSQIGEVLKLSLFKFI